MRRPRHRGVRGLSMVERKRHIAKAVTYRVLGSAGTMVIAAAATGDAGVAASIGVLDSLLKIGFYYAHERLWYRVRWGFRASDGEAIGGHPGRAGTSPRARGLD